MKNLIAVILVIGSFQCGKPISKKVCSSEFFECANECSNICANTIRHDYEFGKCFSQCSDPCRREHCQEARMVKQVDTKDLKSFAIKRGGSSPSVSNI